MKQQLIDQRKIMQVAIGWLNHIENCEDQLKAGKHAIYFQSVRIEAEAGYIKTMALLIESAIEVAQVEAELAIAWKDENS